MLPFPEQTGQKSSNDALRLPLIIFPEPLHSLHGFSDSDFFPKILSKFSLNLSRETEYGRGESPLPASFIF